MSDPPDLLSSPKRLLARAGLRPRKRFGQNFLVDARLAARVASAVPGDAFVIEIGGGTGTLTDALASRARKIVVLEIDHDLVGLLDERFASATAIEIRDVDALEFDFPGALQRERPPRSICGNLPYNITTPLIERIVACADAWETAVLMVQREYARRLCAAAGTTDYGSLTVFVSHFCTVSKIADVGAAGFYPIPAVASSVVQLTPRANRVRGVRDEAHLLRTIRAAFAQRRKTLANCIAAWAADADRGVIGAAIRAAGIDPGIRGERLTLDDFRRLSNSLVDADIE